MFRELLQNSDDAQSDSVQIYFETAAASRDPPALTDLTPSDVSACFLCTFLANVLALRLSNGPSRIMAITLHLRIGPDSQRSVRCSHFNTWCLVSCNMIYLAKGNSNPAKVGAFGVGELNDPSGVAAKSESSRCRFLQLIFRNRSPDCIVWGYVYLLFMTKSG